MAARFPAGAHHSYRSLCPAPGLFTMLALNPAEIIISPDRQRQEFDPQSLQELIVSIRPPGKLQNAPVVRWKDGTWVLVSGERRVRAIKQIQALGGWIEYDGQKFLGAIPCTNIGELDPIAAEEAELDENFRRKDLTWQEHAAAVKRLHNLRDEQKKQAIREAVAQDDRSETAGRDFPRQTVADTAQELTGHREGSYQDAVRAELLVADHLSNPLIARAASAKEALKILKADEQRQADTRMAATIGLTFSSAAHRIANENCLDFMTRFRMEPESEKFDVLLCDPPYGMNADQFGDGGGKMTGITHDYDDSPAAWLKLMEQFTVLSFEVTKTQAHAYIFCDIENFFVLRSLMQASGWYVFRTPFTYYKRDSGRVPLPDRGPRRQTEWILYAIKGDKPVTHIYPDVVEASADDQMGHGAQKSVSAYQNLLQRSCHPGDRVADLFAGTGPIIPAAHALKCYATAVELDPANYARCVRRVKELEQLEQPQLPMKGN